MTLIIPFVISTILIILNIEPFKTAGIFLSICYLPGLSIFALARREKLFLEDLVLAFPCSIGISSLLTVALLFLGINVKYIFIIIHVIVGITALFCVISRSRKKSFIVIDIDKKEIFFCLVALLITIVLSIPFFVGPNRASFAAHALHHSSFVSQILNGNFPPENPGMGGTRIGYYWGFHAFIAVITSQTYLHQIQIIYTLNAISLLIIFYTSYVFVKAFKLPEGYCYMFPVAVIGLMRFDAGIFMLYKFFSGGLPPIESLKSQQFVFPMDVLNSWIGKLSWYDTRLLYINKFYNISAMPVAISLCLSCLMLSFSLFKKKENNSKVYSIILYIIIASCMLIYPPLAIFPLLHVPIWTMYIFISNRGSFMERTKETLKYLVPYVLAVLTALPYLLFVMAGRDISSSGQGRVVSLDFYSQSFKNIMVFLIPFPLIVYGVWAAYKRLSLSRELFFLLIGTALCLGLSVFTHWTFDNSYKFNYILTFFFALFFVFALSSLLSVFSRRWFARLIIIITILFLISSPLIVESAFIVSSLSMDWHLYFSKGHIIYAQDKEKNKGYEWIRENTPPNALIMLDYIESTYPCCGNNRNYEVAAISERNLYVIKDTDYTTSNPEYAKRVRFREKLFTNPDDPHVIDFFKSLNRPVYLLLDENPRDIFLVDDRMKTFTEETGEPFELKFQNGKQRVYYIHFK